MSGSQTNKTSKSRCNQHSNAQACALRHRSTCDSDQMYYQQPLFLSSCCPKTLHSQCPPACAGLFCTKTCALWVPCHRGAARSHNLQCRTVQAVRRMNARGDGHKGVSGVRATHMGFTGVCVRHEMHSRARPTHMEFTGVARTEFTLRSHRCQGSDTQGTSQADSVTPARITPFLSAAAAAGQLGSMRPPGRACSASALASCSATPGRPRHSPRR